MKVQRIKYKSCGCIRQEDIHFVTGKRSYTNKFARYVAELSRIGTIKDVSLFLNISWDTTKDIQNRYLQRHYGNLNLSKLEYIGIDEFAVRKGHVYKTIVADLLTGQVVYVGDGKGADALKRFWKKVRKAKTAIKAVANTPYDDNPDVYRAGMFSIYTGLRKNDILALRWEDTHHDRVRIYISGFV